MKKNASRIIALALVVMMALALIPLGAHAEGTYKVHFESRSSFARGEMADVSFQNGTVTLPRCDFHPQGFAFVEWIDLANESKKYANGDVITLEEAGLSETNTVLNLGAVWREHAPVTVSFDGGGADGGAMSAVSVAYDDIYTVPACGFTKTNYSFSGWKDSEDKSYAVESGHALTANLTLTAQWTQDSVTVTLQPGEASGEASTGSHPKGNDYTVPACSFTAPGGKTFDGWLGSDGESYQQGAVIEGLSQALTLTAQWKSAQTEPSGGGNQNPSVSFIITLVYNNGSEQSETRVVNAGQAYGRLPTPERENYDFDGWFDGETQVSASSVPTANTTLTAHWTAKQAGGSGTGPSVLTGSLAVAPASATAGETLTATFTATSGDASAVRYQWRRGTSNISGATASSYTTTEADAGTSISCIALDANGKTVAVSNSVNVAAVSKGTPGASPVSSSSAIPENVVEGQKRNFGSVSGTKTAVYDVTPCWNGDPTKPMTPAERDDAISANGYIPFYLDYPSGTGNGGFAFFVYHYGTNGLKPVHVEDTGRNLLVHGTEFSPFLLLAIPTGPADDGVLLTGSPVVNGTLYITWGDSVAPTYFQWTRNGTNIVGAAGASYTSYRVTSADVGYKIACKVTPGSGAVITSNYVIPTVGINPACTQGVYNDGETATGVISNVTPDMEYIREADYIKSPATAKWIPVTGTSITGLKKGGVYIVRLKAAPSVTASVNVPEYYSVRVYEKVKDTRYVDANGNSAPRHGTLTPTATIVEKGGKVMTVTATPNKNYAVYDIEVNGTSVSWSKVGNDYKVSLPNVDRRTDVDVRFVYTGSSPRTGDDSNLALWAELAALSLLGLGAVITVLKKKSKA